ncbi:PKD domain-containing protein [uncultured Lacinutrix sp.]|uniref:DUF7849 domain-containing protein n=1 Tax=uncultured Lacinutrix sp. TaxID=574032 RepID=UPI002638B48B|nr:PKD domain-containing protein [uncultured Lacinutrix sp.]
MKTHFLSLLFSVFVCIGFSQETQVNDTLRRTATIEYNINGTQVNFTPKTPPLNQIAGAPKAFYNHFWEFGDGDYSKEEAPNKTYKKEGEYEVKHWATNVYDTGKPPTSRPKKIKISQADETASNETSMLEDLSLIRNREPIPEEEIVIVLSYKNIKDYATNGSLYLFYNEQKYKADNFELADTRTYNGETKIGNEFVYNQNVNDYARFYASSDNNVNILRTRFQDSTEKENIELTLAEAKSNYKKSSILKFKNMKPNEERNVFYTLETTPEMLKDTSAIISVRSVYIPDENYTTHKVKDMEMEIVTSHDPNKMSSNSTFLNYRLVRFKRPKFKIKFQNNGEGPARTIRLETDIPDMFDKSTIRVDDMYPKVKICPKREVQYSCLDTTFTNKQAIFTFKNIYLPGSEQKNVKDYDSTKGFVKYSLKFGKDFHKQKTKSQTAIIFDKNDPIITNYSTTRFLPGLSVGVKTGYNSFSDLEDSKSYFVGATLSPYKSYRWYWQVELLNSFHQYSGNTLTTEGFINTPTGNLYQRTIITNTYNNVDWEIPVLVRYNINNYIGLGAGLQGMLSLSEKEQRTIKVEQFENINMLPGALINSNENRSESSNSFTNFRTGFLVEATAGFVRIGPSLGARYVINFKDNFNYLQLYAIWKF